VIPVSEPFDPFWFAMYAGWFTVLVLLVVWAMEEARNLSRLGDTDAG
jgi:hypothetical protein